MKIFVLLICLTLTGCGAIGGAIAGGLTGAAVPIKTQSQQ